MSHTPSTHFTTTQNREAAGPFELGTVQWLREFGSGDRPALAAGYWFVTTAEAPEPFPLTAAFDETFHLQEGRLRIEFLDEDETVELAAGDSISYNAGANMRWTVVENASKFFIYSGGEA
ncbi:MAG: cupin domain-containing protein [Leucobacter sp.]